MIRNAKVPYYRSFMTLCTQIYVLFIIFRDHSSMTDDSTEYLVEQREGDGDGGEMRAPNDDGVK